MQSATLTATRYRAEFIGLDGPRLSPTTFLDRGAARDASRRPLPIGPRLSLAGGAAVAIVRPGDAPVVGAEEARMLVLEGHPNEAELCIVRLSVPAGHDIAPREHQAVQYISVIAGALAVELTPRVSSRRRSC